LKELLTSVRRLASTKITIFQYRRKSLHESEVKEDLSEAEKNGAYGVAGISRFWSH
jgi:thiamine monophosphate synthase